MYKRQWAGTLSLTDRQMNDVAKFCNQYPNVEMQFEPDQPEEIEGEEDEIDETPAAKKLRLEREGDKPKQKSYFGGFEYQYDTTIKIDFILHFYSIYLRVNYVSVVCLSFSLLGSTLFCP